MHQLWCARAHGSTQLATNLTDTSYAAHSTLEGIGVEILGTHRDDADGMQTCADYFPFQWCMARSSRRSSPAASDL
eukprot:scaffold19072_cov112-Isochrysis_galbana.AAC.1